MSKKNDFWLIDSNLVGVIRFYENNNKDGLSEYMFVEEGIVMGINGEKPPLMKTRREVKKDDARLIWKNLINEGWQKTNPKW